ncbi:TauD/TfdA family dioxygenase [Nocardia mangyaensis]|uniref:TauD/TfdA family dioxygenase n=1 Tax=Nocardia mangyaensis TaxID=2213200 RepID=UPI00267451A6|nr:TauD/TfdA family dioxygenase [Nocardia mangyaensis]MDO3645674.1 TauD/TfdA family dioxygenase [Nocardia mangyaensis]
MPSYANESQILADAFRLVSKLPPPVVATLAAFSSADSHADAYVLRGMPILQLSNLSTPSSHGNARYTPTADHILTLLLVAVIGSPIGYSTQQGGRIVNDIMPLHDRAELANSSNGFKNRFGHHTEDSFLSTPPTYFTLRCIKDPVGLGVSLSPLSVDKIDKDSVVELFKDQFEIPPNPLQSEWARDERGKKPILFGDRARPCFRFNHATVSADTKGGREAILSLLNHLDSQNENIYLQPGDMIFVDNYRASHSRGPYNPSLNGDDRWLLRVVAFESVRQLHAMKYRHLRGNILSPQPICS